MRPDKKSVTDEVWDDQRVLSFLAPLPRQGRDDPDFTLLVNAYRGMRSDDFGRFVGFFARAGHALDARNELGQTFVEYVASHRLSAPFVDIMVAAGAASKRP